MKADSQRLAKLVGLSQDAINEHIGNGVIAPGPDGLYDVTDCFKKISEFTVSGKVSYTPLSPNRKGESGDQRKGRERKAAKPATVAEAIKVKEVKDPKPKAKVLAKSEAQVVDAEPFETLKEQKSRADVNIEHLVQRATVRKMIVDGIPKVAALKHMTEKMGMSLIAAGKYYQEVVDDFRKLDAVDRDFEINRARERFEDLYSLARNKHDYRSATVIMKEYLQFFGIVPDPPKRDDDGANKVVRPMIYLPDNGRGKEPETVSKPT